VGARQEPKLKKLQMLKEHHGAVIPKRQPGCYRVTRFHPDQQAVFPGPKLQKNRREQG